MFNFVRASEGFFLFLDPRAPFTTSMVLRLCCSSTRPHLGRYAYTSIGGLRDMGTHGSPPARVPEALTSGPDLPEAPPTRKVGPATLSTTPTTPGDLIKIPKDPQSLACKSRQ